MLGCIEAMLWLSGEPLRPYWGDMGVKVWVLQPGLGAPGHKVWVLPRGLRAPGHNMCVLPHGLGGLVGRKSKAPRVPWASGHGFGALGGRGVNSQVDSQIEVLWIYG